MEINNIPWGTSKCPQDLKNSTLQNQWDLCIGCGEGLQSLSHLIGRPDNLRKSSLVQLGWLKKSRYFFEVCSTRFLGFLRFASFVLCYSVCTLCSFSVGVPRKRKFSLVRGWFVGLRFSEHPFFCVWCFVLLFCGFERTLEPPPCFRGVFWTGVVFCVVVWDVGIL